MSSPMDYLDGNAAAGETHLYMESPISWLVAACASTFCFDL